MQVVFYGGAQAQRLCALYQGLSGAPETAHWVAASARLNSAEQELLGGADMVALQVSGMPLAADFDAIAGDAERVLFPELALDFLWPFGGQPHVRNTRDAYFPAGPFPVELGDAWLNRRIGARQQLQAIEAEYLALDVAEVIDLDRYKTMALERQAEFDQRCGEDFATLLAARFQAEPLFANPTTPGGTLIGELADRLFAKMRAPFTRDPLRLPQVHGPELPIHPSVARHFGLAWAQGRRYRTWTGDGVDFEEYVRRYLAYAEGPELEAGVSAAAKSGAEAQGLLEKALARPMGRRSLSGAQAMARVFFANPQSGEAAAALRAGGALNDERLQAAAAHYAAGRWSEAEAAALTAIESAPASADLQIFLALVRDKRGDKEGRVAALRAAVALRPADRELQSRLTLALSAQGDLHGAIASAEATIALAPDNPHPRAFLSQLLERAGEVERARAELARALQLIAVAPEYAALREALSKRQIPDRAG